MYVDGCNHRRRSIESRHESSSRHRRRRPRRPRRCRPGRGPGLSTLVLEAGDSAGAAVREWGHVRLFSPWSELVDPVAEKLLAASGWTGPEPAAYPTGREWVERYLAPLAEVLATSAGRRDPLRAPGRRRRARRPRPAGGRGPGRGAVQRPRRGVREPRGADRRGRDRRLRHVGIPEPAGRRRLPRPRRGRARRPDPLRHPGPHGFRGRGAVRRQARRRRRARGLGPERPGRPGPPRRVAPRHPRQLAGPPPRHRVGVRRRRQRPARAARRAGQQRAEGAWPTDLSRP